MKNTNNEGIKSPSILILTDPRIDVKGRFGRGSHLGYYEERSSIGQDDEGGEGEAHMGITVPRRTLSIPMSSDRAYVQLREQNRQPVTTFAEIKAIADRYSKQFGIPVTVSQDMGNNRYSDALACMESGRVKVHLHPILQYRNREYIESVILRAVEECRDFLKERAFGWQRG
jgi:hypothetical protein